MTTTGSATGILLIGNRNSDLYTSCLPTNGELVMSCVTFFTFSKIKMPPQMKLLSERLMQ